MLKRLENIERKFLTQEEFTKILNVSFVSISRLGRGKFELNMENKEKLVALFNEIGIKLYD